MIPPKPLQLYNQATHLPPCTSLSATLPDFRAFHSFRVSLTGLVKRRGTSQCFTVTSTESSFTITITRTDAPLPSTSLHVPPCTSPNFESWAAVAASRERLYRTATSDFIAGNLSKQEYDTFLLENNFTPAERSNFDLLMKGELEDEQKQREDNEKECLG